MGAAHSIASTRPGTPGLDVFKIAGRSISGFLHSFKTGESRQVRLPFTTHLEERLALFLEYHPHVRSYQRGDASVACAQVRGVDAFDKIWRNVRAFIAMQQEQQASKPAVSLWFTAMKENLHELPGLIDLAYEHGIREIHLQRLVYFEQGLAHSKQALFRRSTREELELVRRCEALCQSLGIVFSAAGSATPVESLIRDFGDRPWSGCQRPYTLTYITSSGNVLSCCFAPFGHKSAREYQEERVLGNVFKEPIEAIWSGDRYEAFRRDFESDHPARHCSQCGINWSY